MNENQNIKTPQGNKAQHSPLPWRISNGEHYDNTAIVSGPNDDELVADCIVYNGAREGLSKSKANARIIVASVNHADKLAEAIAKIRTAMDRGLDLTPSIYGAIATLKAYEDARQ